MKCSGPVAGCPLARAQAFLTNAPCVFQTLGKAKEEVVLKGLSANARAGVITCSREETRKVDESILVFVSVYFLFAQCIHSVDKT